MSRMRDECSLRYVNGRVNQLTGNMSRTQATHGSLRIALLQQCSPWPYARVRVVACSTRFSLLHVKAKRARNVFGVVEAISCGIQGSLQVIESIFSESRHRVHVYAARVTCTPSSSAFSACAAL